MADAYDLDADELGRIAVDGIESTWLDASDRRALAHEFEAALSELGSAVGSDS